MSHSNKHNKKKRSNNVNDNLDDIIAMSNDEDIKKKNDGDTDDDEDKNDDDGDDEDDGEISDDDDEDGDSDDEGEERMKRRKAGKIRKVNDEASDEYVVPKIKGKKAKPRRQSDFTKEEISEIKKSKAIEELGNKLNNNLHQIQIALPYQEHPPLYVEANQPTTAKIKKPMWKRRRFKTTLKIIIYICIFIIVGVFAWKYMQAIKTINERNNVFNDNDNMNKGMNGGDQDDENVLSDRAYNSIGSEKQIEINKSKKIKNKVRNRDSHGRFIKN